MHGTFARQKRAPVAAAPPLLLLAGAGLAAFYGYIALRVVIAVGAALLRPLAARLAAACGVRRVAFILGFALGLLIGAALRAERREITAPDAPPMKLAVAATIGPA
jgi:hypothetical protein